jgi:hypothetical protein
MLMQNTFKLWCWQNHYRFTTDQLLIDTNYDGIYESGITEYSSFEIRFRLNSTTPLVAGTGLSNFELFIKSISFTHKTYPMTHRITSFKFFCNCVPKDQKWHSRSTRHRGDKDGIPEGIEALISVALFQYWQQQRWPRWCVWTRHLLIPIMMVFWLSDLEG